MLNYVFIIALCVLLIVYGWAALFKKDLIWKLRSWSARLEGKDLKRDDRVTSVNRMGNLMGGLALLLGIVGLVLNVLMIALVQTF